MWDVERDYCPCLQRERELRECMQSTAQTLHITHIRSSKQMGSEEKCEYVFPFQKGENRFDNVFVTQQNVDELELGEQGRAIEATYSFVFRYRKKFGFCFVCKSSMFFSTNSGRACV
jgi:hypothetical protein